MNTKLTRILFILMTIIMIGFSEANAQPVGVTTPADMDEGRKAIPQGERISAPGNVQASDGDSDVYIYIYWDSMTEASYYELYASDDEYSSSPSNIYSGGDTSYDDYSGYGGTYYYYWVKACDEFYECSEYSSSDEGYIRLDPPSSVNASDGTSINDIEVSWNTSSRAIGTAFEVWRYDDDIIGSAELLDTVYGTSYSDQTANPGKYYYYWVKACGDDFCSEFSYPDDGFMDVEAATGVSASDGAYTDKVEITWNFMPVMDAFNVYRNTSDNPTDLDPLDSVLYETSYSDMSADPGTTYYYWVKACGPDECSSSFSTSDSGYRLALNYYLFLPLILK